MDIKQQELIELTKYLYRLDADIQANNKFGHTDINHDMEDVSIPILNIALSLNLHNINLIATNKEAFDLVDDDNKILIQVTSTTTNKKIKETINGYKKLDKKYSKYTLYMFFLCKDFNVTERRKKFVDDGLINGYICFNDIINIAQNNNEILLKLKDYLLIHNKNNTLYTTRISEYYSIHNPILPYTASNFNGYINNCKDFFKSQIQVLYIYGDSGCGKSHLIKYIIDNKLHSNYIPVLIHNQNTNDNFLDDFNKNINWLFIIEDIELFDKKIIEYISKYIIEYKNSKLIITSNCNIEDRIHELYLLNKQTIFIEWEKEHIEDLEKYYREHIKKHKINHIKINTIIDITKNNPALFIYIIDNSIKDIQKYKLRLYSKTITLLGNKSFDEHKINKYLFLICINNNINKISSNSEENRDINIVINILKNNYIIYNNGIYKFKNDFTRTLIGAVALEKSYDYILLENIINSFNYINFQYLKNIYTYLNDKNKHHVLSIIKNFLSNNISYETINNIKYFAEYMVDDYFNAILNITYSEKTTFNLSYFVLNTKITKYIQNNLDRYLNIVYIMNKNSYTINKFYFKYFLNDLSEHVIDHINNFYNDNKDQKEYINYFLALFETLYDITPLYTLGKDSYSCSFSYNINDKAVVDFLFNKIEIYSNLALFNNKGREIIKFIEKHDFTGEYEKIYNRLSEKFYEEIELFIDNNIFEFDLLIDLRVSLMPYINTINGKKYKYLLSKIYSNKYLYLYLLSISNRLYKFNVDIEHITHSRDDNEKNTTEFINNNIHNFTTKELVKVFRKIKHINCNVNVFYGILFHNNELYNILINNNYHTLSYPIKILLAKCNINKNNIKIDDCNKPEEYFSFMEILYNDNNININKQLKKYYNLANKSKTHYYYNLYVFYDITIQYLDKLNKDNIMWLFQELYNNFNDLLNTNEKYIYFLYKVLKYLSKNLYLLIEDYKYNIYDIITKHIAQLHIHKDNLIDIYNLFNNTIEDFKYFITSIFNNINENFYLLYFNISCIVTTQEHFNIIIDLITDLYKQNKTNSDFFSIKELLCDVDKKFYANLINNAIDNNLQTTTYILIKLSFIDNYDDNLKIKILNNIYPIIKKFDNINMLNDFTCIYCNADLECWKYIDYLVQKCNCVELKLAVKNVYEQYKNKVDTIDSRESIPDLHKLTEQNDE